MNFAAAEPDDSYEAALRAADALFSNSSRVRSDENRPNEVPDAPLQAASAESPRPEKNGGRILRVIDEAPLPGLAALEAERAPKRRGRKPGSKNKPKVALVTVPSEPEPAPGRPARSSAALTTAPAPSGPPAARVEALVASSRDGKRTGWGQGRLRPGEGWKRRRLPRVCW